MSKPLNEMTDLELAIESELTGICLFGFDTYKHENHERAAGLRARLDEINAEGSRRGLLTATGGFRPDLAKAAEESPEVETMSTRNRTFIRNSL